MPKIAIIGAGSVGSTAAMKLAQGNLGDIVLIDIDEGAARGKALDIQQSLPFWDSDSRVTGTGDFSIISGSDVVVITAGVPRKPGMDRQDLVETNSGIIRSVCRQVGKHAPDSVVIVVTNPLDSMAYLAFKVLGFPRERVMGMAGVLDSVRMRSLLSMELGIPSVDVDAVVMGSHGDSMVPVLEHTTASGKNIRDLLPEERIREIVERTRKAGAEIVSHLKTGSAYFAPAASIYEMASAVIRDSGRVLPVSAYLEGEYGFRGIFLGVPARLGKGGIRDIVELELEQETRSMLEASAREIERNIRAIESGLQKPF